MTEEEIRRLPTDGQTIPWEENEYEIDQDESVCGAEAKRRERELLEKRLKMVEYREIVPCCRCAYCIIIRESRLGQVVSVGYGCTMVRANVTPFHTCTKARDNGRGPLVLVRKLVNAEPRTDFGAIPDSVWDVSIGSNGSEKKNVTEGSFGSKGEGKPTEALKDGVKSENGERNGIEGTFRSEGEPKKPMSKVVPRNLCN